MSMSIIFYIFSTVSKFEVSVTRLTQYLKFEYLKINILKLSHFNTLSIKFYALKFLHKMRWFEYEIKFSVYSLIPFF